MSGKRKTRHWEPPRYRPDVEQLGERVVPAITTASFNSATGTLYIADSNASTTITMTAAAADQNILVSDGGAYNNTPIVDANTGIAAKPNNTTLIQVEGNQGHDTINLAGIVGYVGTTELWGDDGNDTISGTNSTDKIMGGADGDSLIGNGGNDSLYGGQGGDIIRGGFGNDYLYGQDDSDQLFGDGDDDWLYGGDGSDQLTGGPGVDRFAGGLQFDFYMDFVMGTDIALEPP